MTADLRARIDAQHAELARTWVDPDTRFAINSVARIIPVEMASAAPAETPAKPAPQPAYTVYKPERAKSLSARKNVPQIKKTKPGRVRTERRDPATCTHKQNGRSLWFKSGHGKLGQQKVMCLACNRGSQMVDGVVLDPGPYVAPKVPNPPADMAAFLKGMADKHGLTPDDAIGMSRLAPIIALRREIVVALSEQYSMTNGQIAAVINKDRSTVQYLLATRKAAE